MDIQSVLKSAHPDQIRMAQAQLQQRQQQEMPTKKNNSWLSVIPSALAAGASFIPGVGTVAAAGLGAVGEGARQALSGENLDLGKIALEGGLSAIPGGLGKASKLLKFGKGAKAAEEAVQGSRVASKAAQVGGDLQASARGITPGATAVGQDQLGVSAAGDLNGFLDQVGVKGGSAKKQLGQLEQLHGDWKTQLHGALDAGNVKLSPTSITGVKDRIMENLGTIARLPNQGAEHELVTTYMTKLGNVKDVKGLQKLKNEIDQGINYRRSAAAVDPLHEEVSGAFRTGIRDSISEMVPATKPLNDLLAQSHDAQSFLKNAAKNPKGFNILGHNIGGEAVQAVKSTAGNVANKGADIVSGAAPTGSNLLKFGKSLAAQGATRGVAGAVGAYGPPEASQPTVDMQSPADLPTTGDVPDVAGANVFSPEMLQQLAINDITTTGGKNLDKIKMLDGLFGSGAAPKQKALSAEASKQVANAKSGLRAIDQVASSLQADPNAANKNAVAGLLGNVGQGAAGTQAFEAAKNEIIDVISRSRSGAALTAAEIKNYKNALPRFGDSPDVAAQKLARFQSMFQDILDNQQQGSPALEVAGATAR